VAQQSAALLSARRNASAVHAMALSLYLSVTVCLSVCHTLSRCSIETAASIEVVLGIDASIDLISFSVL